MKTYNNNSKYFSIRKEDFGFIVYDKRYDKFWRFSKDDFEKFKAPQMQDYSRDSVYGTPDIKLTKVSAPLSIGWMVTNRCNCRCIHCRASSGPPDPNELGSEELKLALKMFSDLNVLRVVISGGEPLISPYIDEVLTYGIEQTNLNIVLGTNGLLINRKLPLVLKVGFVETSLDSAIEQKHDRFRGCPGSFKTLMKNIKLISGKVPFRVFTTLSKLNYKEVNDLTSLVFNMGANEHEYIRFIPTGRGANIADQYQLTESDYIETIDRIKSLAGVYRGRMAIECFDVRRGHDYNHAYMLVRPNGRVYTSDTHTNKSVLIGQIPEQSLTSIWNGGVVDQKSHLELWTAGSFV